MYIYLKNVFIIIIYTPIPKLTKQNRKMPRQAPSIFAFDMAGASLISIRESLVAASDNHRSEVNDDSGCDEIDDGVLELWGGESTHTAFAKAGRMNDGDFAMTHLFSDGHVMTRSLFETILRDVHSRAIDILINRYSHERWARFGPLMMKGWSSVQIREVIYALSTAHNSCLHTFRVIKGHTIEWVGNNTHRMPSADSVIAPSTGDDGWSYNSRSLNYGKGTSDIYSKGKSFDSVKHAKIHADTISNCVAITHNRKANVFWFHSETDNVINETNYKMKSGGGTQSWTKCDLYIRLVATNGTKENPHDLTCDVDVP